MSSPRIPTTLTLDACIGIEHDMMYNDPDHRDNTRAYLGHEPSPTELVEHWYRTKANLRLQQVFNNTIQERVTVTASTA